MSPNRIQRAIRSRWQLLMAALRSGCKRRFWTWNRMGRGVRFGCNVFVNHPHALSIGDNVTFGNNVEINNSAESTVVIGANSHIDSNTVINVNHAGRLYIGSNTKINKFNFISCNNLIEIGSHVMTAAFCHILDANHGMAPDRPMREQNKVLLETHIGDDVWIGTMCTVLAGSRIGSGVVLAANSSAREELAEFGIYAGSPARRIGSRV